MRTLRFAILALLTLGVWLLLGQPAEARERSRSRHSRHQDHERESRVGAQRSPWDWHPGMLGESWPGWSPQYGDGLCFGYERGGWRGGYPEEGWSAYYDDGNLRLRYSRGGICTGPGCGVKSAPWLRSELCPGCGNQPGCCRCDYGQPGQGSCGGYYPGDYYGRQRVIVFSPGRSGGYDYPPGYGEPLYVDGQAVYPQAGGIYYDNRVINNYYGDGGGQASLSAEDVARGGAAAPEETLPAPRPYGSQLFDRLRLNTPDGEREFVLREGVLSAGSPGAAAVVATGVDSTAGAFALIEPELGTSLIYLRAGVLYGAFQTAQGKWHAEALPLGQFASGQPVLVAGELSLGLVGNEMWASFSASDGARYLFVWEQHRWREIGSAR